MEPLPSHETLLDLNQNNPKAERQRSSGRLLPVLTLVLAAFCGSTYWTFSTWAHRANETEQLLRTPRWSIETPSHHSARSFVRTEDTSFWTARAYGLLTSNSKIATQHSSIAVESTTSKSHLEIAPLSIVNLEASQIEVQSGLVKVSGPVHLKVGDQIKMIPQSETVVAGNSFLYPAFEPAIGSIFDLQTSERITFSWSEQLTQNVPVSLEFARDPSFSTILFTEKATSQNSAVVDFGDRSTGAWFVRLQAGDKLISMTSFNLVESQVPDQLRRLGRRWLTWRDRGLAAIYRVEFSENENFQTIHHSIQVRNRELDLSRVPKGKYFVRVIAATVSAAEFSSRPIFLEVQDKAEILHATLELNDPELKLQARGWRILLTHDEVSRIREGYVILRESELRGIKSAQTSHENVVFELSREESFSNPERVRPDSRGELLPPALPLGVLHARLRRVEADGTLGASGPSSRLTTWLPAPLTPKPKTTVLQGENGVELKWQLHTSVAGYELRLSTSRDFTAETTKSIRTRANSRRIAAKGLTQFFWTVTAINEMGLPVSLTSAIQEVKDLKPSEKINTRLAKVDDSKRQPDRKLAMIAPTSPIPQFPDEDAVIVGGATATKYGKLIWTFESKKPGDSFEVQIATDGDFVNVIEKGKTTKQEFVLQGDLPEGALFWRVKKSKTDEWSRSRRFELVYE